MLQIIVDGNCDMAVRQVASIHFKNFIAKNWSPHDPGMDLFYAITFWVFLNPLIIPGAYFEIFCRVDEQSKILPSDKDLVRQNILVFIAQVPPLLR